MPYEIVWEPNGAYKRFYGHVTSGEFMKSIGDIQGDVRFDSLRYTINDYSDVTGHTISMSDVKKFAAFGKGASHHNPNIRIAVISTDNDIIELVSFYASPPFAPFLLEIFPTLAAARAWIHSLNAEAPEPRDT